MTTDSTGIVYWNYEKHENDDVKNKKFERNGLKECILSEVNKGEINIQLLDRSEGFGREVFKKVKKQNNE
jgi:hypothetical protein